MSGIFVIWTGATLPLIYILFIVFILKGYLKTRLLRNIPAPQGLPVVGNVLELYNQRPDSLFRKMRENAAAHRPIYRLSIAHIDIINILNPDDVELILSTTIHLSKSKVYSFLNQWLGTGLLTSTGHKWHTRRKILTPAFHFKILEDFLIIFREESTKLVSELENHDGKPYLEIWSLITQFTLQCIGETAMGFDSINNVLLSEYKTNVLRMEELFMERLIRPWCRSDFIYNLTTRGILEKEVVKKLHSFSNTVIKNREYRIKKEQNNSCSKKRRLAMLDLLLQAKYNYASIDEEGIREEVDTFMFEGHDTTSAAICLILMLLANNKDSQDKIRTEIDEVLGENQQYTYRDLQKLTYLERCIKEGLRLYPSVPVISRYASQAFWTKTGYLIPEGTIMHLHIFDIHRDPDIYQNPEKFDPDRFLPMHCADRHPFAYVPFSAGPRNCIGQKFAMLELKTVIIGILKNFILEAVTIPEDLVFKADLVLKTSEEIKIKFNRI